MVAQCLLFAFLFKLLPSNLKTYFLMSLPHLANSVSIILFNVKAGFALIPYPSPGFEPTTSQLQVFTVSYKNHDFVLVILFSLSGLKSNTYM